MNAPDYSTTDASWIEIMLEIEHVFFSWIVRTCVKILCVRACVSGCACVCSMTYLCVLFSLYYLSACTLYGFVLLSCCQLEVLFLVCCRFVRQHLLAVVVTGIDH